MTAYGSRSGSRRAAAAMLVARRHRSPLRSGGELAHRLQDAGAAVVGSVMNQP